MEPLISVIVPVYKVESYLDQCLASITGQTYRNLEILLVDDGSPVILWISIHALVGRATERTAEQQKKYDISIHALVGRATFVCICILWYYNNFNPRPRGEGDFCN